MKREMVAGKQAAKGAEGILQETPGHVPGEASRVCQTADGREGGQVGWYTLLQILQQAAVQQLGSASCSSSR